MSDRRHFYAQPQAEEISRNAVHGERSELNGRQPRVEESKLGYKKSTDPMTIKSQNQYFECAARGSNPGHPD